MREIVRQKRQKRFDEIHKLVNEIVCTSAEEYQALPPQEKKRRKDLFWDSLLDWYIDGFAAGLIFIDRDLGLPDPYKFLDITYPNGETVSDIYEKDITNPEAFLRMVEAESNRVWNTGMVNAGVGVSGLYKTWETMEDDRVRDTHWFLEGKTIPFEDKFITFDGDSAEAPGMFEDANNNVNCRCWLSINREV